MKFRYLIERGIKTTDIEEADDGKLSVVEADLYVTIITPGDDTGHGLSTAYRTRELAQAAAEEAHKSDGSDPDTPLKWKDPPKAWQPDALAVSQYLDDGVEENRDA